ncbi:Mig-14 family protein [Raoultella ornithinolytica]|uniref:Mig-14 family protein n=1 Tax=Raoultella ornithinolytica TaxID=54291 RepID=UPI0021B062A5|nr:Mig-14 family protein [Raoultella ornithinolytica]MCT4737242.1 Mig-14 family protein [Raoultella ornithinolytica]
MGFKHQLLGWERSSFDTYTEVFQEYGGSINTSPEMVEFFMRRHALKFRFWHYQQEEGIIAAYFLAEDKTMGLNVWRDYPLSFDEIIIPVSPQKKVWLPDSTNRLSSVLKANVVNASFALRRKRKICHIKDNFSAKTIKKRKGELKKFLSMGGECHSLTDLSAREIAELYVRLFKLRFADTIRCYDVDKLTILLSEVNHMVYGNVLFFNNTPCSIDLMLGAESKRNLYFDVPNGGIDPKFSYLSPGSLVMWANICVARSLSQQREKKMTFSIGSYEKNWDYKLRWADTYRTGKVLTL